MNRPLLACAFFALASTALVAQDATQSQYSGTSNPPPDDTIITTEQQAPVAKPSPAHPMTQTQPAPAPMNAAPRASGTDHDIVTAPPLNTRASSYDPDSDIVHPAALPPGTIGEGTLIRIKLLDELSSNLSEKGQPFRSRVATDVLQNGQVVIPAGAEIDGRVADLSTGHLGGHGSILLEPETVTLENGSKFRLHAMVASTPGTNARVNSEGLITPGSRLKRDGIEYAGVGGGGMAVGAVLGGPVGMLAGGIVGAGVVTAHLLQSHPQTTLTEGSYLMLTVTEQVQLVPATPQGN
ncbi:hypothetical protein [Occallatibacter savannae]|uniref:hypothetical protein n=1 Tax=Occallatibacter savannae TaxID=1002691 RepID=UPI000D6864CD|nr:hypothetical protein [Occallatibacter savannae]